MLFFYLGELYKPSHKETVKLCSTILAIQTIGIPMGSPLSPALAILTCARAEEQLFESISSSIRFKAMRYIDDIWICLMKNREEKDEDVQKLFKYYDRHLKIEKEREGKEIQFLDRKIIWNGEELKQVAHNKNTESMKENGERKFMNMIPYKSYGNKKMKKAIIIGKLIRIQLCTTKEEDILWQGWIALTELQTLGYKNSILKEVCGWMDTRYRIKIWRLLFYCFELVGKYFMSQPFRTSS